VEQWNNLSEHVLLNDSVKTDKNRYDQFVGNCTSTPRPTINANFFAESKVARKRM